MFFHWTRRSSTAQIMEEGLLPEPPRRQFTTKNSLSPTFGGVYYCRDPRHFANIINNMSNAKHGMWLYDEPSLIFFEGQRETFPDEDDLFLNAGRDERSLVWVGPIGLDEEGSKLATRLELFKRTRCPEEDFPRLREDVRKIMRKSAKYMTGQMERVRGNIWKAIEPEDLTVLHFTAHIKGGQASFAYDGNIDALSLRVANIACRAVQALNEAKLPANIINNLYPYDGLKNFDLPEHLWDEEDENASPKQ